MKLNANALALTSGLLWGLSIFIMTWWIMLFDGATGEATIIGLVYRGYNISPMGSVWGLIWGLVDGYIGGLLIAVVYNFFAGKGQKQPTAA